MVYDHFLLSLKESHTLFQIWFFLLNDHSVSVVAIKERINEMENFDHTVCRGLLILFYCRTLFLNGQEDNKIVRITESLNYGELISNLISRDLANLVDVKSFSCPNIFTGKFLSEGTFLNKKILSYFVLKVEKKGNFLE